MKLRAIQIIEKDNNKKGDLFGRLMGDLFHALGYEEPRLNVHKSGREIDLIAKHRTEKRTAIAECKAHEEPIGGSDINKFIGVLDAESRKLKKSKKKTSVQGYFISISGFKETAIEQENEIDDERVILIKPEKLVDELVKGRILISLEEAISKQENFKELKLAAYVDLIAHAKGWIWVLYYSDAAGQKITHFALVHAEGKPLIGSIAQEIIEEDKSAHKLLAGLVLLNKNILDNLDLVKDKYFNYLQTELGQIHFEGLPTDKEAGSVKVKLENIFVPPHLTKIQYEKPQNENSNAREGIGKVLGSKTRLAILARPGGGKSTLIKRVAIAYAFPDRRKEINDNLPDKPWFPIFLRCRELGERVTLSITEIINAIPVRAELAKFQKEFSLITSNFLQDGNALLLIDGLDEIVEDRNRIAFVSQLRTFIATYPSINIIVTSREAGFRVVGGALATYCDHYRVSNLNETEIELLCLKWHCSIIDETQTTIKEAKKLSDVIIGDRRIRVLAENPLLLTTLLFVKRWAGYLPTKRNILYQEMIKLLLVTWNVEGHEQLDIEEAEPQLAFIAYLMTKRGVQTITEQDLLAGLIEARDQMPAILGYTNISPADFIKSVEFRSSILIMTGHQMLQSGIITQVYEFLHLSFQEYLTARAIVKRYIPIEDASKKTIDLVKPHVNNEAWKEVIPMTAVLLERENKELIEYLVSRSKAFAIAENESEKRNSSGELCPTLLGSCLANEIQINPELLNNALEWYGKNTYVIADRSSTEVILKSKFGPAFRSKMRESFFVTWDDRFLSPIGSTLADLFLLDVDSDRVIVEALNIISTSPAKEDKCIAILGLMGYAFRTRNYNRELDQAKKHELFNLMLPLLKKHDYHYCFSICWAIAWSVEADMFPDDLRQEYVEEITKSWVKLPASNLRRTTSWALRNVLLPTLTAEKIRKIPKIKANVDKFYLNPLNKYDKLTATYLKKLLGMEINASEVLDLFKFEFSSDPDLLDRSQSGLLFAKAFGIDSNQIKGKTLMKN